MLVSTSPGRFRLIAPGVGRDDVCGVPTDEEYDSDQALVGPSAAPRRACICADASVPNLIRDYGAPREVTHPLGAP